jgi:hypothetical protein
MREAGAPSTEEVVAAPCCARPTGIVMVASPKDPRNAEGAQSEGRARGRSIHKARPGTVYRPEPERPSLWVPRPGWSGGGGSSRAMDNRI